MSDLKTPTDNGKPKDESQRIGNTESCGFCGCWKHYGFCDAMREYNASRKAPEPLVNPIVRHG